MRRGRCAERWPPATVSMQRRLGVRPKSPKSRQRVWAAVPLTLLMCSETNITPNYPHRHVPFYGFKPPPTPIPEKQNNSELKMRLWAGSVLEQRVSEPTVCWYQAQCCHTLGGKGGSTCSRRCKSSSYNFLISKKWNLVL